MAKIFLVLSSLALIVATAGCNSEDYLDSQLSPTHSLLPPLLTFTPRLAEEKNNKFETLIPIAEATATETPFSFSTFANAEIQLSNIRLLQKGMEFNPPFVGENIFWSPDGKWIGINNAKLLYLTDGIPGHELTVKLPGSPTNLIPIGYEGFSVALNYEKSLMVWDPFAETVLFQYPWEGEYLTCSDYIPTRDEFVMSGVKGDPGSYYRVIELVNSQSGEIANTIEGFSNDSCDLEFSKSQNLLVISSCGRNSKGNQVSIWNIDAGSLVSTLPGNYTNGAFIKLNRSGDILAVAEREMRFWSINDQTWIGNLEIPIYGLYSLGEFSNDGQLITSIEEVGKVLVIREVATGEIVFTTQGKLEGVKASTISPNGKVLAILTGNGSVELWVIKHDTTQ
jgi:hypothetical protein